MTSARERTPVLAFKLGIAAHNMNALVRSSETTNGDGFRYRGKKRSLCRSILDYPSRMSSIAIGGFATQTRKDYPDEQSRG
jgi:hypothetical protein